MRNTKPLTEATPLMRAETLSMKAVMSLTRIVRPLMETSSLKVPGFLT